MKQMLRIIGVDEAGRGPLAGPVVAAAVILDPQQPIDGLTDSKKLSLTQRECLEQQIKQRALAWSLGRAEVGEIDQINILQASLLAMRRAILALQSQGDEVRVDGNQCPLCDLPVKAIVKGDLLEPCISAASILAKQARDREMLDWHQRYPHYGFDRHKGYPTRVHLEALRLHGVCEIHRRSYAPVREIVAQLSLWSGDT